jgi:hypothetical protein
MRTLSRAYTDDLERHIMRCRRREEPASVLVARIAGSHRIPPRRLLECFRLTDSVTIARTRDGWEVAAIFDEDGFDRDGLERRFRAALAATPPSVAWARFPEDGVTLDALLASARAALPACAARASGRRAGAISLWAARE